MDKCPVQLFQSAYLWITFQAMWPMHAAAVLSACKDDWQSSLHVYASFLLGCKLGIVYSEKAVI